MSLEFNCDKSNTISNALNIKNKRLNSSIFLKSKETDNLYEENESYDITTNVTIYSNSIHNNEILDLHFLKESIENMSKFHQIEILRIISKKNAHLNENSNGTFVNLTEQPDDLINDIKKYVKYVTDQQSNLSVVENEKYRLEQIFSKDNKDK